MRAQANIKTGKTESAKIIAKHFFGSEKNLIKINMSEYSSEMDVSKLVGASSGYVGYSDEPYLIKQVRSTPNSVVLFDECEKAHPSVWKILLNILDEGEMKDNKGNSVSFRNTIIIFTTNLGCDKNTGKATGMSFVKTMKESNDGQIMNAIQDYFRPEFLARLDDIIIYDNLPESIAAQLVERYRDFFAQQSETEIKLSEDDVKKIIEDADIKSQGARGLKRATKKYIALMD